MLVPVAQLLVSLYLSATKASQSNRVTVANSLAGTVCTFAAGLLWPIVLLAHWLTLSLTRRDTIRMRSTQQDGENQVIGKQVCLMLSNLLI